MEPICQAPQWVIETEIDTWKWGASKNLKHRALTLEAESLQSPEWCSKEIASAVRKLLLENC